MLPSHLVSCPFFVLSGYIQKPSFQIFIRIYTLKAPDVFCLQIAISHLHSDLIQILLCGINVCITLCLRQMNRNRFLNLLQIPHNSFDLINHYIGCILDNSIRTSIYYQRESITRNLNLKWNFCMVICPHSSLDLPVHLATKKHGFVRSRHPVINISAS